MANLLTSSQCKATVAPSFYTTYLNNIACRGNTAQQTSQYVGAQPLQEKAFQAACKTSGEYQPAFKTGLGTLGCAANKDISGAATPYITQALNTNTGQLAQCYMSPYINSAVQNLSDITNRNIQQNLAPTATAAAVGSGQFGSQRGAQVLGQVEANAMQDLNSKIACMENAGYGNALNAATARGQLLNSLGQTAGTTTAECAKAKTAAGLGMGTVACEAAKTKLACINALATLGAQCQTIKQNAQCYPMSTLAKYSSLLQGHDIPTTVKTSMCMSPLSAIGAVGTGVLGVLCKYPNILCTLGLKTAKCVSSNLPNNPCAPNYCTGACGPADIGSQGSFNAVSCEPLLKCDSVQLACAGMPTCNNYFSYCCFAKGGLIQPKNRGVMGCASLRNLGGLPARR